MSGKVRGGKVVINSSTIDTASVNQRILLECHDLYSNDANGLVKLAQGLGIKLLAPRKKINVLLIGNHSAGKSSFVNWYIEKHVQKEGVAIETQGITFITNGKKRETLTGNGTLHLYPHFEPLSHFDGLMQYLCTEICDSIAKRFSLVTFIDTPGLVDGNMRYAFDVNNVLKWLADQSDQIFVFFDPIGQALCKRTMSIVGDLGERHAERMSFYLSKSDEAGDETDRQRVLMQITQEVCKWPSLNRTCFDIQTIYNPNRAKPTRCVNQIDEAARSIERTINLNIQNTLNSLEKDCNTIATAIETKLAQNIETDRRNFRARLRGLFVSLWVFLLPLAFGLAFAAQPAHEKRVADLAGAPWNQTVHRVYTHLTPLAGLWALIPPAYIPHAVGGMVLCVFVLFVISKLVGRTKPTLSRGQKKHYTAMRDYVQNLITNKKRQLYDEYLKQSVKEF